MVKFHQTGDFRAGLFYLVVGIAALWIGRNYTMGTADDMGSGYFPFLLSLILIVIGSASVARSILGKRMPAEQVHLRAMTLITAATLAFAMIIASVGAVIALPVLTLLSASASRNFAFGWKSVAAALALSLFCVIVFIKALGLSIPVTGWLFGSYL
jgi:hypothetical protein